MNNTCVSCGATIPEGRQVCYRCEHSKFKRILFTAVALSTMVAPTTAHAEQHDMGTLCMDVNYDGIIDGMDASMVLAEYAATSVGKSGSFTDTQRFISDTNLDGVVDGRDASKILAVYAYNSTHDKELAPKTATFKLMCAQESAVSISIDGKYFIEDWYHTIRVDSQDRLADTMYYIDVRIYNWNNGVGEASCLLDVVENEDGYTTQINQYWLEHNGTNLIR